MKLDKILDIIREICDIIASTPDHAQSLRKIVKIIANSFDVDVCSIYEFSKEKNKLVLIATEGLSKSETDIITLSPDEGITGRVFSTKTAKNLINPKQNKYYKNFPSLNEEQYLGLLSVPLKTAGKVIGVLNLQHKKAIKFSPEAVRMMETLSPHISSVIINSRMDFTSLHPSVGKSKKTEIIKGVSASSGISMGYALFLEDISILDTLEYEPVKDIEKELKLFDKALEEAKEETIKLEERASDYLDEADASIFYTHILMLQDPTLVKHIRKYIHKGLSLPYALKYTYQYFEKIFSKIKDDTFAERLIDIKDIILRILVASEHLKDPKKSYLADDTKISENIIIVAHELYPSQIIRLPLEKIAGIICETGSKSGHVAILSKALHIPAIVSAAGAVDHISQDDPILVDANSGTFYVRPPIKVVDKFKKMIFQERKKLEATSSFYHPRGCTTADDIPIKMLANISLLNETPYVNLFGADGIGLYRSEYMLLVRTSYPDEDAQFRILTKLTKEVSEGIITIRLFDIGADKPVPYFEHLEEQNPALGLRSIRMLLKRKKYLEPHLIALLRTTLHREIHILIPMISKMDELRSIMNEIEKAKQFIADKYKWTPKNYKIGIMIETPAILWDLENIMQIVDFVSIGSNDLIQYSFAIDRENAAVSSQVQSMHPVILKMIKHCVDISEKYGKEITLCGEMATDPEVTPLLIGAGLKKLSMIPSKIPEIKKVITNLNSLKCKKVLNKALEMSDSTQVRNILKNSRL
ncbi:MAG: phosphoenolpyruvate--protein phosphotransferase [Verrucomicrobiota bacterium]|nr:phosphoenolpyruvate--protein phosphotransferase [Verrucomicrobiota bacterium]